MEGCPKGLWAARIDGVVGFAPSSAVHVDADALKAMMHEGATPVPPGTKKETKKVAPARPKPPPARPPPPKAAAAAATKDPHAQQADAGHRHRDDRH